MSAVYGSRGGEERVARGPMTRQGAAARTRGKAVSREKGRVGRRGLWAQASGLKTRLLSAEKRVRSADWGEESVCVCCGCCCVDDGWELPRGGTRQEWRTGGNVHNRSRMARAEAGGQSEYLLCMQQL